MIRPDVEHKRTRFTRWQRGRAFGVRWEVARLGPTAFRDPVAETAGGYVGGHYLRPRRRTSSSEPTRVTIRQHVRRRRRSCGVRRGQAVNDFAENLRGASADWARRAVVEPGRVLELYFIRFLQRVSADAAIGVPAGHLAHCGGHPHASEHSPAHELVQGVGTGVRGSLAEGFAVQRRAG